jgi:predicted phage baseplate assembly protein
VPAVDELYGKQIVEIEWAEEDALPFALCISSIGPATDCCKEILNVSVARGNVILIDHGRTVETESFDIPPAEDEDAGCEAIGQPSDSVQRPVLFYPALKFAPLTHSEQFPRPQSVARQQARLLGGLLGRVRQYVDSLWRKARDGRVLTADELTALQTIFSRKGMIEVGLVDGVNEQWKRSSPADQAEAIANLVLHEERWLARKISRVETLRARAAADYKLEPAVAAEISGMFGEQFGRELSPSSSTLFGSASGALQQDPRESLPYIRLSEVSAEHAEMWETRRDLLDSDGNDRHFVTEIDDDSMAHLRFGNGDLGRAPEAGATLVARYRIGNGKVGNVGAETITRIVFKQTKKSGITLRPRNPLPSRGGTEPETIAEAKLFAPGAFRKQLQRAVIADDYARLAERSYKIQRAAASLAWTGSWYEASVAVDPLSDEPATESLLPEIERYLDQYRRIGHSLRVNRARYVPLDVEMEICVLPNYLRGHVKEELGNLFSNRRLADGRLGFFHPDNLSFGDGIYLSKLVAAAQGVTGIESVRVAKLQRLFEEPHNEIENGVLPLDAFEIAQLDNDPNFPERGKFALVLKGGR